MEAALRLIRDTETAAILGCSRATVWALVKTGRIPAPIKIGSMTRWRLSDIQIVIDQASEKPSTKPKPKPKPKPQPRDRKKSRLSCPAFCSAQITHPST